MKTSIPSSFSSKNHSSCLGDRPPLSLLYIFGVHKTPSFFFFLYTKPLPIFPKNILKRIITCPFFRSRRELLLLFRRERGIDDSFGGVKSGRVERPSRARQRTRWCLLSHTKNPLQRNHRGECCRASCCRSRSSECSPVPPPPRWMTRQRVFCRRRLLLMEAQK